MRRRRLDWFPQSDRFRRKSFMFNLNLYLCCFCWTGCFLMWEWFDCSYCTLGRERPGDPVTRATRYPKLNWLSWLTNLAHNLSRDTNSFPSRITCLPPAKSVPNNSGTCLDHPQLSNAEVCFIFLFLLFLILKFTFDSNKRKFLTQFYS